MEFVQLLASLRPAFSAWALVVGFALTSLCIWLNSGVGSFRDVGAAVVACVGASALLFFRSVRAGTKMCVRSSCVPRLRCSTFNLG